MIGRHFSKILLKISLIYSNLGICKGILLLRNFCLRKISTNKGTGVNGDFFQAKEFNLNVIKSQYFDLMISFSADIVNCWRFRQVSLD